MNQTEFTEKYLNIVKDAIQCSKKAKREGLLALEEDLDIEKIENRDIFQYGLRFVIDGTKKELIEKILSNIIDQEKDEQLHILKTIQKEAVIAIQEGLKPRLLAALLNSLTDNIQLDEEEYE